MVELRYERGEQNNAIVGVKPTTSEKVQSNTSAIVTEAGTSLHYVLSQILFIK